MNIILSILSIILFCYLIWFVFDLNKKIVEIKTTLHYMSLEVSSVFNKLFPDVDKEELEGTNDD